MCYKNVQPIYLEGKRTEKVVPLFSSLSKVTVPPKASFIRFITTKPRPWPIALVVNMGVNILAFALSGMPTPVSLTVMTTSFDSSKTCIY